MDTKIKIKNIIKKLSRDLIEREEVIRFSLLALMSGESIFLLGPPGVGKSLVARKINQCIKGSKNFEYLMNKFSTPDEIFGPISLAKLDEDKYERKIDGYLPDCEIGFLDEIWKASPAIQNTLLTIINEKIYRNGTETINVPLMLLIAASNELPEEGSGLEALFDRFTIRMYVDKIKSDRNFKQFLANSSKEDEEITDEEKLTIEEILETQREAKTINVDEYTQHCLMFIRNRLRSSDKEVLDISDRRWKKLLNIMKVSALCNGRKRILYQDLIVCKNVLKTELNEFSESVFDETIAKHFLSNKLETNIWNFIASSESLKLDYNIEQEVPRYRIIDKYNASINANAYVHISKTDGQYHIWFLDERTSSTDLNAMSYRITKENLELLDSRTITFSNGEINSKTCRLDNDGVTLHDSNGTQFKLHYKEKMVVKRDRLERFEQELDLLSEICERYNERKNNFINSYECAEAIFLDKSTYRNKLSIAIDEFETKHIIPVMNIIKLYEQQQ